MPRPTGLENRSPVGNVSLAG